MATALADPLVSWEKTEVEDPSLLMALSRADRASIAEDTLRKLQAGGYRARDGVQIRFEKDIAFTRENSVLYTEDDLHKMKKPVSTADDTKSASSTTKFEVLHCTTLQAAQALAAKVDEDSIGVLNFASAKNPGGGFLRGASAQEESLARTSSLYLALTEERFINGFYDYNRRGRSGVYSNRLIYSPRVTVFKDDDGHVLPSPYHVGIVTVPAPNAGVIRQADLARGVMMERVKRLLYAFQANKHEYLVLGAFGCGVFRNDPLEVARIFRQYLISNEFCGAFKRVIFAVYHPDMCQIFQQVFNVADLELRDGPRVELRVNVDHRQPAQKQNQSYRKKKQQDKRQRNAVEHGGYDFYDNYRD